MSGRGSYQKGVTAEQAIAKLYRERNFKVKAIRWLGQAGEIDLIFERGDKLVFTEVKASKTHDRAAHRLSRMQMERQIVVAQEYLASRDLPLDTEFRFDVGLVDMTGRTKIIENAFGEF